MLTLRVSAISLVAASLAVAQAPDEVYKQGHSLHGEPFDVGPREKPWPIAGIGKAPFPISTKNPEVQQWFDQGNALLHSFWYYEAERSFRWCLKREPDTAMADWGVARSASGDRAKDFAREAVKRKGRVSEREGLYIEALEAQLIPAPLRNSGAKNYRDMNQRYQKKLKTICVKYPADMEA